MPRTEVTGTQIKDQSVSLTADVTGILPVANGGSGSNTLALNNVLLGNGTGALQAVAPGTSGNVLTSNGSTWTSAVPTGGSSEGFVQTIGNGSATTITITHNLNTRNVLVSVKRSSTNAEVECDVVATTVNAITLTFATAPTTNELYVTVLGAGTAAVSNALSNPLVTNSGNSLTLPTTNETLVGRATTDTLTNKTISGANNTIQNVPTSALPFAGAATAFVGTEQTTTSAPFTDLTTTTDQVTVTIGASGLALVMLHSYGYNSTAGQAGSVSFAMSGANTLAAASAGNYIIRFGTVYLSGYGTTALLTGLTAGSTTFKMKYSSSSGTSYFSNRTISVIPL